MFVIASNDFVDGVKFIYECAILGRGIHSARQF